MPLPSSIGRVKAAALAAAAARREGGAIFLGRLGRVKVRKTMPLPPSRAAKEEHTYEVKEFQNQDQDGPGSAM